MSRRMNTNARGRQSQNTTTRGPSIKLTFGGKTGQKNGAKEATTISRSKKKRRLPSFSEAESTTSGGESEEDYEGDEESDEAEADDESEEPAALALSHHTDIGGEAGPIPPFQHTHDMPLVGEWDGFPDTSDGEDIHAKDLEFEKALFDSDDDLVYERVNEVSDSEEEGETEAHKAEAVLVPSDVNDDMTSHFANQIDGMSAYGFGDDSEEEGSIFFPFSSSDEANDAHERRVRFEESLSIIEQQEVGMPNAFAVLGHSPTMTRALLPSAMPERYQEGELENQDADASDDDGFDSDATEELAAPAEAWQLPGRLPSKAASSPPAATPTPKRPATTKGPIRGVFEDNGEKTTAILDASGRRLVISDAHLLGGVFARKYGPSVPASPSNSFASAVLNESDSAPSQASGSPRPHTAQMQQGVDLMLSGLTSGQHISVNGQAIGLPEAFMPANSASSFLNDFITADLFNDDDEDPEKHLRLEDMLEFGTQSDDEEGNVDSSIPAALLPESISMPSTPLAHLNHMNVTAFKRKAEPTFFKPTLPSPIKSRFATPHKRKRHATRTDSPYNDAHYQGVTPVQRITYHEHSSSPAPSSVHMHKRRKTIM